MANQQKKRCNRCGVERPIDDYGVMNKNFDGMHKTCKVCINSRSCELRKLSKEHPQKRDYYHGNKVSETIEEFGLNFNLGNVIKYVLRAGHKPGESRRGALQKAADYLAREIRNTEGQPK